MILELLGLALLILIALTALSIFIRFFNFMAKDTMGFLIGAALIVSIFTGSAWGISIGSLGIAGIIFLCSGLE